MLYFLSFLSKLGSGPVPPKGLTYVIECSNFGWIRSNLLHMLKQCKTSMQNLTLIFILRLWHPFCSKTFHKCFTVKERWKSMIVTYLSVMVAYLMECFSYDKVSNSCETFGLPHLLQVILYPQPESRCCVDFFFISREHWFIKIIKLSLDLKSLNYRRGTNSRERNSRNV